MSELQIHTFDISHKISEWEARKLKEKYQINNQQQPITKTGIKGINQIQIRENHTKTKNANRTFYRLHLQINLGKLLGISNIAMVSINKQNGKKMEAALHKIMEKDLQLFPKNCNAKEWILNRVDCGMDIKLQTKKTNVVNIYIRLLNHALNLYNNRNCSIIPYKGYSSKKAVYESVYFGNKSYTYNIYNKLNQLTKMYPTLTPEQKREAEGLLRIEKQLVGKGIVNGIGKSKQLSLLLDDTVIEKISSTILKELKLFFGEGDFVSYNIAVQKIAQSNYSNHYKRQLLDMMIYVSKYGLCRVMNGLLYNAKKKGTDTKEIMETLLQYRNDLKMLGISVSGIKQEEATAMGTDNLPGISKLFSGSSHQKPVKRRKGAFGRIYFDKANCRYRCNFSAHDAQGKGFRVSVVDKDKERLEQKILDKLKSVYQKNLQQVQGNQTGILAITKQTKMDVLNFRTIIGRTEMLKAINLFLNQIYF